MYKDKGEFESEAEEPESEDDVEVGTSEQARKRRRSGQGVTSVTYIAVDNWSIIPTSPHTHLDNTDKLLFFPLSPSLTKDCINKKTVVTISYKS